MKRRQSLGERVAEFFLELMMLVLILLAVIFLVGSLSWCITKFLM